MAGRQPIVLSAGGTGGHLFPAQALGAELSRRGWKLILMTDPRGHNYAQAFPSAEIVTVPSATFAGRSLFGKATALFTLGRGMLSASAQLGRIAPAAVVGFGGYPSLPTLYAASRRDLPTLVHEQNAILGRVNRYLAPRVSIIAASFEGMERVPSSAQGKVVVTGNPVRETILALTELSYLPPDAGDRFTVLVFGGSQGARVLSQIIPKAVRQLPEALRRRLRIEQQCRPEDLDAVGAAYEQTGVTHELAPFFSDMGERLIRAHLVISRAGASTVTELTALGRPAILIPYPFAMDDHQSANARVLADRGGAIMVPEKVLTAESLTQTLERLVAQPEQLTKLAHTARSLGRPGATTALADAVEGLALRAVSKTTKSSAGDRA